MSFSTILSINDLWQHILSFNKGESLKVICSKKEYEDIDDIKLICKILAKKDIKLTNYIKKYISVDKLCLGERTILDLKPKYIIILFETFEMYKYDRKMGNITCEVFFNYCNKKNNLILTNFMYHYHINHLKTRPYVTLFDFQNFNDIKKNTKHLIDKIDIKYRSLNAEWDLLPGWYNSKTGFRSRFVE